MILTDPREFLAEARKLSEDPDRPVTMRAALLVAPADFHVDVEGSPDNVYIRDGAVADPARALLQHQTLSAALNNVGVPVITMPGLRSQPDGVFPNNAFGTVPGTLIVGSMAHPGRRAETRRSDVRELFSAVMGYNINDLSGKNCIAELTGVLVIDHPRGIGYCGMSQRVDEAGCRALHEAFGLNLTFRFDLNTDEYHTNVVMSVLAGRACVIFPGAFQNPAVPEAIVEFYGDGAVVISAGEKAAFAGNCLAVTGQDVFMGEAAVRALRPGSRGRLESRGFRVHGIPVDELEKAGGSLRCLIAEIF
jgi:hypothetical protein